MNNKGVTLIELLIVIVVLGIISAFAVPSVSAIIENTEKDKVYNAALIIEESTRLYCIQKTCLDDQVLTSTELSSYVDKLDDSYDYTATKLSSGVITVTYIKAGNYSFPFDSTGTLLENKVPSLSSRNYVNKQGIDTGNPEEPDDPVIPDGEPYVLLNGSSTVYVEITEGYSDPGAKAYTSEGTLLGTPWQGGTVNFWMLGTYTRTYNQYSSYDNKNCIPVERTIIVVDTTPPVITINGGTTVTRPVGTWYSENGAWAQDNSNESVTVTRGGDTVDINTIGTYYVTYTSTDSSGNTATATKTVIVN